MFISKTLPGRVRRAKFQLIPKTDPRFECFTILKKKFSNSALALSRARCYLQATFCRGRPKGGRMSKIKTEGDTENRKHKKAVDIANISSLTAARLFQLAAQLEVRPAKRNGVAAQYAGSYPRFE